MDTKEKRILEAFAQYESGESLATLQRIFSDVSVELNQMVEAEQMLKRGRGTMKPSPELGRRVVAALAERARQNNASIFMSGFWRLAAPVGIAALSFMFVLAGQHTVISEPVIDNEAELFAVQEAAPMMAKNAAVSLMAVEAPATDSFALMADDDVDTDVQEPEADSLYVWQMIALGLLVALSVMVLIKHYLVRRRSAV